MNHLPVSIALSAKEVKSVSILRPQKTNPWTEPLKISFKLLYFPFSALNYIHF
jgi:hypothetical protein